ncbi:hypothetical protein LCGC14_0350070 [marine sediment metagenome]|uniref:Uncharacterized protein n=1 Tax=marine sediment metagenome TaxID=412755 RepID=A0A0F9TB62_9ZZZZ
MKASDNYPRFDAKGVKEHYQELSRQHWIDIGRKEVVEWAENHSHKMNTNMYGISLGRDEWQNQLKEWGIE